MNGVQTRFKCKLDVKRCKRFVFPPSSLLPRSNALKTKAIRYFQTDRTLTRIVSPPLLANGYGTDDVDARFEKNFYAGIVEVDGKPVMMDNGQQLEYFPLELKLNLTGSSYVKTAGARMAKYEVDRTSHSDGRQPDNDIVLFRYADALLMKSEAKVRNGEDGSLELNEVRGRVGMPYREATLENILKERLLELVWEGWRRQDMVRFGVYHKSYDQRVQLADEKNGYTTVFPIPQKSIDLNPKLKQNVGYK